MIDSFHSSGNFSLFQIEIISLWISEEIVLPSVFYQFCWNLINTWWYNLSYSPNNSTFSDCKISGAQIPGPKFCPAAPHICRYSVSNFLHVSLLAYKNFRRFLEFLENLWIPGLGLKIVLWPFKILLFTINHGMTSQKT